MQKFKCRHCQATDEVSGFCLGCGRDAEKANCAAEQQAAAVSPMVKPKLEYCAVCKEAGHGAMQMRVQIPDGRTKCRGCKNEFEPVEFVMSSRDPSIAAEKDEEFEQRKKLAKRHRR